MIASTRVASLFTTRSNSDSTAVTSRSTASIFNNGFRKYPLKMSRPSSKCFGWHSK